MTRQEAKTAFYNRLPVEIYVTSIGWVRQQYINALIYTRPDKGYDDRNVESELSIQTLDKTGRAVSVATLKNARLAV